MTFAGIDYTSLESNPAVKADLENAIKQEVVATANNVSTGGQQITAADVQVQLSAAAGSVRADITVTPPAGVAAQAFKANVIDSNAGTFTGKILTSVQAVPAISTVATGSISATAFTATVVPAPTQAPTPAPTPQEPQSGASHASASALLLGLAAVLAAAV